MDKLIYLIDLYIHPIFLSKSAAVVSSNQFSCPLENYREVSRIVMQSGNDLSHRRRLCIYTSDVRNRLGGKSLLPALTRRDLLSQSRFHTSVCSQRSITWRTSIRSTNSVHPISIHASGHHRSFVVHFAEQFCPWPLRESCALYIVRAACSTLVQYEIVTYAREHANYPRNATTNFLLLPRWGHGGSFLSLLQSLRVAKVPYFMSR